MKPTPVLPAHAGELAALLERLRRLEATPVYVEMLAAREARTEPLPLSQHGTDRRSA